MRRAGVPEAAPRVLSYTCCSAVLPSPPSSLLNRARRRRRPRPPPPPGRQGLTVRSLTGASLPPFITNRLVSVSLRRRRRLGGRAWGARAAPRAPPQAPCIGVTSYNLSMVMPCAAAAGPVLHVDQSAVLPPLPPLARPSSTTCPPAPPSWPPAPTCPPPCPAATSRRGRQPARAGARAGGRRPGSCLGLVQTRAAHPALDPPLAPSLLVRCRPALSLAPLCPCPHPRRRRAPPR